jgi:hypothetical protein
MAIAVWSLRRSRQEWRVSSPERGGRLVAGLATVLSVISLLAGFFFLFAILASAGGGS